MFNVDEVLNSCKLKTRKKIYPLEFFKIAYISHTGNYNKKKIAKTLKIDKDTLRNIYLSVNDYAEKNKKHELDNNDFDIIYGEYYK